jgi:lysophospholipase L1-like esterase
MFFNPSLTLLALQTASTSALRIASIGSSFAAGPGLSPSKNYAHLLSSKLSANLSDLAVSGSTLLTMLSDQIPKIPASTDIVTITSGGNDLGYIGGLSTGIFNRDVTEDMVVQRWNNALAKIHTMVPKAKVYLVEYLTILGPDVKPNVSVPFNATRIEAHRGVAATLLRATLRAAEGKETWVKVVPVAKASVKNGVGSSEPWVNSNKVGSLGGVAWHPNSAGMAKIEEMLLGEIKANIF